MSSLRESVIERSLVAAVKARGGMAPKLVSPGMAGMPDRIVLMPGGRMAFVELKAPGRKPRLIQHRRIRELVTLGYSVYVVDSVGMIGEVLDGIQTP